MVSWTGKLIKDMNGLIGEFINLVNYVPEMARIHHILGGY